MASVEELGPIDPSLIHMPKAIKAVAASAEELHKQAYSAEPPKEPTEPVEPPKEPTEPVEPPKEPIEPVEPLKAPVDEGSWEHRYKSMKGRYDAEVPRMRDQIRTLMDQVSALQAATHKEPTVIPQTPTKLVTDKDVADYGPEFIDLVGRKAKEEVSTEVQTLLNRINSLESQIKGVGGKITQTALEHMYSTLDNEIPTWNTINSSEDFLSWLHLPDAYSGAIRMNLLRTAFEQCDTPRVLAFFKGFLAEEAATAPAPKPTGLPNSGKVPLIDLAAPGRAKTAASGHSPSPEKPIITTGQITEFYHRVNSGYYAGKDKERMEHEAIIFDAQKDGRIRG